MRCSAPGPSGPFFLPARRWGSLPALGWGPAGVRRAAAVPSGPGVRGPPRCGCDSAGPPPLSARGDGGPRITERAGAAGLCGRALLDPGEGMGGAPAPTAPYSVVCFSGGAEEAAVGARVGSVWHTAPGEEPRLRAGSARAKVL